MTLDVHSRLLSAAKRETAHRSAKDGATVTEPVAKPLLRRAFQVYRDARYEGLAESLNCHLDNLRCSKAYTRVLGGRDATFHLQVPTGPGRKPRPEGRQA